jgi:hypothetical protein
MIKKTFFKFCYLQVKDIFSFVNVKNIQKVMREHIVEFNYIGE